MPNFWENCITSGKVLWCARSMQLLADGVMSVLCDISYTQSHLA